MNMLEKRVRALNRLLPVAKRPVVYWMQRAQRGRCNAALDHAIDLASVHGAGLWVLFVLDAGFPGANSRHFTFLLEGLQDVRNDLRQRGIPFVVRFGALKQTVLSSLDDAGIVVCDEHPEPFGRALRAAVGASVACTAVAVEADSVIPPAILADHAHIGARSIRPALHRGFPDWLHLESERELRGPAGTPPWPEFESIDAGTWMKRSGMEMLPDVSRFFRGGHSEAKIRLKNFIETSLNDYHENHNRADLDSGSKLGPYLHFGHIGPLEVATQCLASGVAGPGLDAFIEQVIVRRELAVNAAWFLSGYGTPGMVPEWAKRTLDEHAADWGETISPADLEAGNTPDPAWNAAMLDMKTRGTLHNYMRMYWGKRVLFWSPSWREGFSTLLRLNDRYLLDGRDPNGTAGVAWVFGLHDRPFPRRPVFGAVRSMTPGGLARKFDVNAYIQMVSHH